MKRIIKGLRKSKSVSANEAPTAKEITRDLSHDDEDDTSLYTSSPNHTTTTTTLETADNDDDIRGNEQMTEHAPPPPQHAMVYPPDRYAETRNLVKKFIADIWNRGELDLIPDVCSPSIRFNGNTGFDRVGHDGLARMVGTIRDVLDEYHCEIHSMVVEDNKAFCRLRFTGKHVGSLLGYPPTNETVAWMGATEFTCQNGKILKVWELGDVKSLEEQLEEARRSLLEEN